MEEFVLIESQDTIWQQFFGQLENEHTTRNYLVFEDGLS